jgi:hypothetical protein
MEGPLVGRATVRARVIARRTAIRGDVRIQPRSQAKPDSSLPKTTDGYEC